MFKASDELMCQPGRLRQSITSATGKDNLDSLLKSNPMAGGYKQGLYACARPQHIADKLFLVDKPGARAFLRGQAAILSDESAFGASYGRQVEKQPQMTG